MLLKFEAKSIGGLGKRWEPRDLTLLRELLSAILPATPYLDAWEEALTTPTGPGHDAGRHTCLRAAQKTLPKSKRCTQRGDMTRGRCQLFDEMDSSAETRGSGKTCTRPSRYQGMILDDAITYGRPWRTRRCSRDNDECILLTSENWHFM